MGPQKLTSGLSPALQGVLAVDSSLEGMQVQLRPSQDKFRGFADRIGGDKFCLNVSDAFTLPNPLRLSASWLAAFLSLLSVPALRPADHLVMLWPLLPSLLFSRKPGGNAAPLMFGTHALSRFFILRCYWCTTCGCLDRPLISALDDLGVPTAVFLAYQKLAIDELSPEALYTFRGAYDTLNRFSYGGATKFKRSVALLEVNL